MQQYGFVTFEWPTVKLLSFFRRISGSLFHRFVVFVTFILSPVCETLSVAEAKQLLHLYKTGQFYKGAFGKQHELKSTQSKENTTMPDPIDRKRLKKRMLDRWENEGGRIGIDTTSADGTGPTSKDEDAGKKPSSRRDNSSVSAPASPTKRRKSTKN